MKMILFILHDTDKLMGLLNAWEEAGATGATVLYSTGLGRIHQESILREDIPLMPSLSDFFDKKESFSRTLFTVVKEDALIEKIHDVTCRLVGDLNQPDTGLFLVLPVLQAEGLDKSPKE